MRIALCLALAAAGCGSTGSTAAPPLTTDDDKAFYALGLSIARNIKEFNMSPAEIEVVKRGMTDSLTGKKPEVELDTYGPKLRDLAHKRAAAAAETKKKAEQPFIDKAAAEPGAQKFPSGLVLRSLSPGRGASPQLGDTVKVNYHGTLSDGTVFDSSVQRGQPVEFPLGGVIPCWNEALPKMKVGEKAKLTCPSSIAYGDGGRPPKIPGGATLQFEVELIEIKAKPATPAPPVSLPPTPPPQMPGKKVAPH
jgi:FKBP-type peptidyl-prolyl cis-trans isomerase FkpA